MNAKGPQDRLSNDNPNTKKDYCIWRPCSPASASEFSAVAYFMGRDLRQALHVPIGLISNAVGGSPIAAWISHSALMADPAPTTGTGRGERPASQRVDSRPP